MRILRRSFPVLLALTPLAVIAVVLPAAGQTSIRDARDARDRARNEQAAAAAQIDVLQAQDAQVAAAVRTITAAVATQQARVDAARTALAAAEAEAAAHQSQVAETEVALGALRGKVNEVLVDDYMGRTDDGAFSVLRAESASVALRRSALLEVIGTDRRRALSDLRGLEADRRHALVAAETAVAEAARLRAELDADLAELQARRADQERLGRELDVRIAAWRSRQDQLEAASEQLSSFIRTQQAKVLGDLALSQASRQGFIVPTKGPIGSGFGMRKHPIYGIVRLHAGVDFDAPMGAPVIAAKEGRVIFAGVQGGYGNVVVIQHAGPVTTVYAHLSSIDVRTGNYLGKGELLGRIGSTGLSTGPHLHFEVRVNGEAKDPMLFLP